MKLQLYLRIISKHFTILDKKYLKTDPMNLIAKLLMNSLYGKFAQKNSIIQIFKLDSELKNMDITEYMKTNFKGIKDWE